MTFKSQVEIDEALRVGTVPRAEIDAFHVAQAQEGLAQLEAEARAQALADEAAEEELAKQEAINGQTEILPVNSPEAIAEDIKADAINAKLAELAKIDAITQELERFGGQLTEEQISPEDLKALEASYLNDTTSNPEVIAPSEGQSEVQTNQTATADQATTKEETV